MQFCTKCGSQIDKEDQFCRKCGAPVKKISKENITNVSENRPNTILTRVNTENFNSQENPNNYQQRANPNIYSKTNPNKYQEQENNIYSKEPEVNKTLKELPLILAIVAIIMGIIGGLCNPVILIDSTILEIAIAIIGGGLGIYLFKFRKESLVAGIEFIITGIVICLSLSLLSSEVIIISIALFIITGIISIVLNDRNIKNKTSLAAPILTITIPFIILMLLGGISIISESSMGDNIKISNVENGITNSYGAYSGDLKGDISLDQDFNYIELDVKFLDSNGKILSSGIGWNQLNAKSGQTYQFTGTYYGEEQPVKAEISIVNSATDSDPIYVQNVTLA